ncbi:MAG: cytochrome c oxidase assembly protein [Gaiellaceae bacterium]
MPSGGRAFYLFAAFLAIMPLGLLLALLPRATYDFYREVPRLYGLSPLADQQIAGATMAVEQFVVFLLLISYFFLRFLEELRSHGRTGQGLSLRRHHGKATPAGMASVSQARSAPRTSRQAFLVSRAE